MKAKRQAGAQPVAQHSTCEQWLNGISYPERREATATTTRLLGLYKILFHFEALLHNNIFLQTPPLLCNILHNITSYCTLPPKFEVFLRCLCLEAFFCFLGIGFWMGRGVWKKFVPDTEKGELLHIIVRYPPPSPPP